MDSINQVGRTALELLSLTVSGGTALAQANAGAIDRSSIDARAEDRFHDEVRDMTGGGQLRSESRSGRLDWGTGGLKLQGELLKSGRRSIDAVGRGSQWHRTYAAAVNLRESASPAVAFEAGARIERTNRGVALGPLLTNPTQTVAQMAYVGVQISDSASIRLIGFDNGGWSEGATGQLARRIANGEPPARKGVALEIGGSGPRSARWNPQFSLRLERGRTAARSATSALISWKVRL